METNETMAMNAKLQQKKNYLRRELAKRGILKREGVNEFDKYKYFSEAQYKALFTELFSFFGLELSFSEVGYEMFTAEGKQSNGRLVKVMFRLSDIETGFYEESAITGEGLDKGDKAGFKAYTGALKYYLANTFLVATGDDAEKESPEAVTKRNRSSSEDYRITEQQLQDLHTLLDQDEEKKKTVLDYYKVSRFEELTFIKAAQAIKRLKAKQE